MAEEHSETDIPSSSEDEDGKVTEISSGNAETEDSSLSERSVGKKDSIPQASPEEKSESNPADKESTSGSIADPQKSVAKSTVAAHTSSCPEKPKSKLVAKLEGWRDKLIKKRQETVSSEERCSADEASATDGPAASSVSSVSGQDISRTSVSAGSSSNSKGVGSLSGRALNAMHDCSIKLKGFIDKFHSKDCEKISIVVTDEDQMDTQPAYHPSFEAPTPPTNRVDLETLDVVPKIYEESPDVTETTTVTDSENKKDASDAEARRAGMSSLEISSVEKDSEESSRHGSSDVLADVSSEEKDETNLKAVKRTPLKRQRKMDEEDSSDSDTGTVARKKGQKRSPQAKRTTRF